MMKLISGPSLIVKCEWHMKFVQDTSSMMPFSAGALAVRLAGMRFAARSMTSSSSSDRCCVPL
jgi:hypothetical protein